MPPLPTWFHRLTEIIEALDAFEPEFVDRATLENLFQLQRRSAINLMHEFGGYQIGRTFLISKRQLVERLRELQAGDRVQYELRRKERLTDKINEARKLIRRNRLQVSIEPRQEGVVFASLPSSVQLQPGELSIVYRDLEELLTNLALLGRAMENDFDELMRKVTPKL
jgi:hypothetical protein